MGVLLMREVLGNRALTSKDATNLIPNLEAAYRAAAAPNPGGPEHPAYPELAGAVLIMRRALAGSFPRV
jgi:hypothetical protein